MRIKSSISEQAKSYYIYEERYDWLRDPKRFERIYHTFRARVFLKKLLKIMGNPSSGKVLDAGCGTGLITIHLPQPIVCVDINPRGGELDKMLGIFKCRTVNYFLLGLNILFYCEKS